MSTTLSDKDATWENSTAIRVDIPGEIQCLKQEIERDILVSGRATLLHILILILAEYGLSINTA